MIKTHGGIDKNLCDQITLFYRFFYENIAKSTLFAVDYFFVLTIKTVNSHIT